MDIKKNPFSVLFFGGILFIMLFTFLSEKEQNTPNTQPSGSAIRLSQRKHSLNDQTIAEARKHLNLQTRLLAHYQTEVQDRRMLL